MKTSYKKQKLGIIGCGAIGRSLALSLQRELKDSFVLGGLYDIDPLKTKDLARTIKSSKSICHSLEQIIAASDILVECVNAKDTAYIVERVLKKKKDILVMSVGRLLKEENLFLLAEKNKSHLFLPSGAIGGLDAVKAASLSGVKSCQLTTIKPPKGFLGNAYLMKKKINLENLKVKKVLFEGGVLEAVKNFPQNINVSASLTFALGNDNILKVMIVADPKVKANIHQIEMQGSFGCMTMRFENNPCLENPKTSYLAVLSAIQTLKQSVSRIKKGT